MNGGVLIVLNKYDDKNDPYVSAMVAHADIAVAVAHAGYTPVGTTVWWDHGEALDGTELADWFLDRHFQGRTLILGGCSASAVPFLGGSLIQDTANRLGPQTTVSGYSEDTYLPRLNPYGIPGGNFKSDGEYRDAKQNDTGISGTLPP
jgi:hypothetical protein